MMYNPHDQASFETRRSSSPTPDPRAAPTTPTVVWMRSVCESRNTWVGGKAVHGFLATPLPDALELAEPGALASEISGALSACA